MASQRPRRGAVAGDRRTHDALHPDEALFAGLVRDIGYCHLLSRTPRSPELAGHPEALDAILREWHPSIGQAVLHSFNLPDAVIEAVGEHESAPQRIPPRTMADVVRLAVLVAARGTPRAIRRCPRQRCDA